MADFDVIVVGGGPAGLSAALMLGRCRRSVLICDLGEPRNRRSRALHGFLTRDGVPPGELTAMGRSELVKYGVEMRRVGATAARWAGEHFAVALSDGREEHARYLLLATGVADDLPLVAGLEDCYGRSVFHCPYCDGWESRDRRIAAYGRGAEGAQLALGLKTWSADIVLCTGGSRVDRSWRARLARNGIQLRAERIERLEHENGALTSIQFAAGPPLPRDVLFFTSGQHPHSPLAVCLGCTLNRRGTVRTGALSDTNVPRVFVAGDASHDAQFAVVAAAEGVKAAVAINKALQHEALQ